MEEKKLSSSVWTIMVLAEELFLERANLATKAREMQDFRSRIDFGIKAERDSGYSIY
jgi:hypothetical protein